MKYQLYVKAEAIQDMAEAFGWYENKRTGLGLEFLDAVEECYNQITQNPEHYQYHGDQRIKTMHRFPYKIVYEVEQETIVVYAVYHDKRNPEKLTKRE
ncbi:MAG: type II toxin-antitoxin system RelE/ParE family toxin [Bacteroidota bacterium]